MVNWAAVREMGHSVPESSLSSVNLLSPPVNVLTRHGEPCAPARFHGRVPGAGWFH